MPNSPADEALFAKLYFDRHIMSRLAIDLRSRGYGVLTTEEAGLDTADDEQQLAFATVQRRAILTFNIRDFAPLHKLISNWVRFWQQRGRVMGANRFIVER